MNSSQTSFRPINPKDVFCEDISEYVAELQLHMTLQAKNLVPSFAESQTQDNSPQDSTLDSTSRKCETSRVQLLHETQASMEKSISRQEIVSCRL